MLGFEKPILVMSVFAGSLDWFEHQKKFLNKTTTNYVHAVCLNNVNKYHDLPQTLVLDSHFSEDNGGDQHLRSLSIACEYARSHRWMYRGFLVLDSDCFPIVDWEYDVLKRSLKFGLCAIVRPENFDIFPHPAAVFTTNPDLLYFEKIKSTNLLGVEVTDIACKIDKFFPMLRTNYINVHPVGGGIYFDKFYHHCAGSRGFYTRSDGYYNRSPDRLNEFFSDPNRFINILRGIDAAD